jgi:hypothetical protein
MASISRVADEPDQDFHPIPMGSTLRRKVPHLFVLLALSFSILPTLTAGGSLRDSGLRIESFGCARAFAVGTAPITLVGTVRNSGAATIPANTVRLKMRTLAGMDYLSGDTAPWVPELEAGGAATFKWLVQPTASTGPLVASLTLESSGSIPIVRVIAIPHLAEPPAYEGQSTSKIPVARSGESESVLENNKVRARIVTSDSDIPVLLISVHTSGGWRSVGTCLPLAELMSGEGGQRPWWEVFKSDEVRSIQAKDEASLSVSGGFGVRWRGTITLSLKANSSVIDYALIFSPKRQMKLSGIRICPLYVGDGSFGSTASEVSVFKRSGPNTMSAVRWGEITLGRLERTELLWKDWELFSRPNVEEAAFTLLSTEGLASETPAVYLAGAVITYRARLFSLAPSASVNDAFKVALPAAMVK